MTAQPYGWQPASDGKQIKMMQRRAVFLAAYQSGLSKSEAAARAGIKQSQAYRYRISFEREQSA